MMIICARRVCVMCVCVCVCVMISVRLPRQRASDDDELTCR